VQYFQPNAKSLKFWICQPAAPDLEKGPSKFAAQDQQDEPSNEDPYAGANQSTGGGPRPGGEQNADDDSDNNDKFWKLFQDEAAAEAKWKVGIWKTELDSLLVFVSDTMHFGYLNC
jgi:hypothetical protein